MIMAAILGMVCTGMVWGSEEVDLQKAKNSVVRVESVCGDGSDEIYAKKEYTGFLITGNDSNIYVITIYDRLNFTQQELAEIRQQKGLDENANLSVKTEIVFQGDLRISTAQVNNSPQRNIMVLRLEQSIVLDGYLEFDPGEAGTGTRVTLLSFPLGQQGAVFNAENVAVSEGEITGEEQKEDFKVLVHNIPSSLGSEGGLILNRQGLVEGMLLKPDINGAGLMLGGNEIRKILDLYDIDYPVYEEVVVKKISKIHILLAAAIILIITILFRQFLKKHINRLLSRKRTGEAVRGTARGTAEGTVRGTARGTVRGTARLLLLKEKKIIPIKNKKFVMGASGDADLVLKSKGVKKYHAAIIKEKRNFYLIDLSSTNYTKLNGTYIKPNQKALLHNNDRILLAEEEMVFRR